MISRYSTHLAIILLALSLSLPVTGLDVSFHPYIIPIKDAFTTKDIDRIAQHIRFPLRREYPLPAVTKSDFAARFDEIFDDELIQLIAQSDIDRYWSNVGWRGIMLRNDTAWVDLEDKISHINYSTKAADKLREQLIANDKASLHPSLQNFTAPISLWTTDQYRVRIDHLNNGTYRYCQWTNGRSRSSAANLTLTAGEVHYEGSEGNHYYSFCAEDLTIICSINVIGKDDTVLAEITFFKDGVKVDHSTIPHPN